MSAATKHAPVRPKAMRTADPPSGEALHDGSLNAEAWTDFACNDWEKNAATLRGVLPAPLVSRELMFSVLLRVSAAYHSGLATRKLSFWIDGRETRDLSNLLPRAGDHSVAGYVRRLDHQLKGAEFTLLVADPHLYDRRLWGIARRFLRGLHAQVGIPCGGVDSTFFIGRYKRTPFGVHRGQMSVMTFPVHREKRFRIWPRGYGEAHPEIQSMVEYSSHLGSSRELTGGPRDVLYWPADIWHIAEGSDFFTSTFNIGFWWDRPPLTSVLFEMSRRLAEKFEDPNPQGIAVADTFENGGPLVAQMDRSIRDAIRVIRGVLDHASFELALALNSMRMLSADGFRDVPDLRPEQSLEANQDEFLRAASDSRIVFSNENNRLYVAANGHVREQPCGRHLENLLRKLQAGEAICRREAAGSKEAAECMRWLERAQAVARCSAAQAVNYARALN